MRRRHTAGSPTPSDEGAIRGGTALWAGTREVVCIPRTTTIMGAVKTMLEHGVRRLPVVDAGTYRLEGMVYTTHIVNLLGGGHLHKLVRNRYRNNLLAAINEDVRAIMERNVPTLSMEADVHDAISTMAKEGVGGLPLLDDERRVVGIITERDVLRLVARDIPAEMEELAMAIRALDGIRVEEVMSTNVVCADAEDALLDGMKLMVGRGFRRLPLTKNGVLIGVVTSSDVVRYLGEGEVFSRLVGGAVGEALQVPLKSLVRMDVLTTDIKSSIKDAALSMTAWGVGCLPVIGRGELVGIITERDVVRVLHERGYA
ncbi:CBS domain-containing protein [Methermicoccus shengliensis]|uniref:CBS domain-containing protein n=1 Tax=Methermicoccus shengliensis TaxID=660064 RepID=A0A832RXN6_9EURY|nr:CBS domain-containing protein [Methermicoccus shengliensis]KUK04360.1 MAG: Putative signal transduction protein [Euryarchaeota archaeon 55_53]MDI3488665.1 hypothetical protein [Methanosarcinales archaeon]HIH69852.1 CBS domain-containing protein [Methermicoccus shengliensis]